LTSDQTNTDLLVHAEKLRLLFNHSFPAVLLSLFTGILLTAVLWPVQSKTLLLSWFFLLVLSSALRLALFLLYRRKDPSLEEMHKWETPFIITLVLTAIIWGVGCVVLMPMQSSYDQLMILYFLMCLVSGVIASYWAHKTLMLYVVGIFVTPTTIWMLMQSSDITSVIAISFCVLALFGCLIHASETMTDALTQNLFKNYELAREKEKVEYLARKDELTNLYNRRAFYEQLIAIGTYCERHNQSLSVIVVDLDYFKEINDKYGHFAGDLALSKVGEVFTRCTRTSDICARLGGEEFGIIIRSNDINEAFTLAEKLRLEIAAEPIQFEDKSFNVTASFGVASGETDFAETVKQADLAMYQAKKEGRNKVILATQIQKTTTTKGTQPD
jgi:diguanylate cyclase (GGDEF)-like protein